MAKKKIKQKYIGKTKILIGDKMVQCTISRNPKGNLEIVHDSQELFPNGTCSDMLNFELTISPFEK